MIYDLVKFGKMIGFAKTQHSHIFIDGLTTHLTWIIKAEASRRVVWVYTDCFDFL